MLLMTMMLDESSRSLRILLIFIFCFWCQVHLVTGKCYGQWAIHACGGGNGKRSELGNFERSVVDKERTAAGVRGRGGGDDDDDGEKALSHEPEVDESSRSGISKAQELVDYLRRHPSVSDSLRLRQILRTAAVERGQTPFEGGTPEGRYINGKAWYLLKRLLDVGKSLRESRLQDRGAISLQKNEKEGSDLFYK